MHAPFESQVSFLLCRSVAYRDMSDRGLLVNEYVCLHIFVLVCISVCHCQGWA